MTPKKSQNNLPEQGGGDASWNTPSQSAPEPTWDEPATTTPTDGNEWNAGQQEESSVAEEDWSQPAVPLTLNIQKHSGRFDPDRAKILIFGETGTHKTRFSSTFPEVLFLDMDHGMSSVTEQVDTLFIEDNQQGFEQLKSTLKFLQAGKHPYTTVVLDTLNEMQRIIMRFTVEEFTHVRRSYGNLPGQSDYGKMLYEFIEMVRAYISLPMRVVLLAQVKSQEFDTDVIIPQLIGKNTVRELMRKMDIVGYIYKTEGDDGSVPEVTFDSPAHATKDRSNRLPSVLPNPSWDTMSEYWNS